MTEEFAMKIASDSGLSRRGLICLLIGLLGCLAQLPPLSSARAQSAAQTVRLVVDYGDGVLKIFDRLPWASGNTIMDALNSAKASPHGITFNFSGSGATAFLNDIDGVKNQGAGSASKNWQYWVNTTYGTTSFAVVSIQATDAVFWRFATDQSKAQ
jgi:hypothetical protein